MWRIQARLVTDRRRVHDHVRDGGDGRYGVVLHLRDKEVDG